MLDPIQQQQELLKTHRRTLAHNVQRAAIFGGEKFAPPEIMHGIEMQRAEICNVKKQLRDAGVAVADEPNDEGSPAPQRVAGATVQGTIVGVEVRQERASLDFAALVTGCSVVAGALLLVRALLVPLIPAIILSIYQTLFALLQLFIMLAGFTIMLSGLLRGRAPNFLGELLGMFAGFFVRLLLLPLQVLAQLVQMPRPGQNRLVMHTVLRLDVGGGASATASIVTDLQIQGINYGDYAAAFGQPQIGRHVRAEELRVRSAMTRREFVVHSRRSWPWPIALLAFLAVVAAFFFVPPFVSPVPGPPQPQPTIVSTIAPNVLVTPAQPTVRPSVVASATPTAIGVRRARVVNLGGAGLNLRQDPSVSARVIGRLTEGMLVELIGEPRAASNITWQQITYADKTGWVDETHLRAEP